MVFPGWRAQYRSAFLIFVQGSRKAEKWKVFFRYPKPVFGRHLMKVRLGWIQIGLSQKAISHSHLGHIARGYINFTLLSPILPLFQPSVSAHRRNNNFFGATDASPHAQNAEGGCARRRKLQSLVFSLFSHIFFWGGEWNCVLFFCIIPPAELLGRRWRQKRRDQKFCRLGFEKKKCTEYCT